MSRESPNDPFRCETALVGFLQMGGGVLAGIVAATRPEGGITLISTSIVIGGFAVLPLVVFRFIRQRPS